MKSARSARVPERAAPRPPRDLPRTRAIFFSASDETPRRETQDAGGSAVVIFSKYSNPCLTLDNGCKTGVLSRRRVARGPGVGCRRAAAAEPSHAAHLTAARRRTSRSAPSPSPRNATPCPRCRVSCGVDPRIYLRSTTEHMRPSVGSGHGVQTHLVADDVATVYGKHDRQT